MKRFTLAILLGWLLLGPVVASAAAGDVPPRPLTEQGLTNLTALSRLIKTRTPNVPTERSRSAAPSAAGY